MIMVKLLMHTALVCLACSSCDTRERRDSTGTDEPAEHYASKSPRPNNVRSTPEGGLQEPTEASLRKVFDSQRRGALQLRKFRSDLLALAKKNGEDPMSIVAPMILEGRSPEAQLERMLWVVDAFDDPATQVDLAKALPAGTIRRSVVSIATRGFEREKDIAGLISAYDSLPVGGDRTDLSVALSKMKINDEGLLSGLDFISQLEMPEERYAAIMATEDLWAAQIRDPQTQMKLDQVVDTMEGHLKENLHLLISSLKRR